MPNRHALKIVFRYKSELSEFYIPAASALWAYLFLFLNTTSSTNAYLYARMIPDLCWGIGFAFPAILHGIAIYKKSPYWRGIDLFWQSVNWLAFGVLALASNYRSGAGWTTILVAGLAIATYMRMGRDEK